MALATPEFLQTKKYSALRMRQSLMDRPIQPGVVGANDFKVVQRAAGANMSVDIGAGSAWVNGTVTSRQGSYHAYNDATVNVAIAANSSGNPRLDQIVLRIYDTVDGGGSQDAATLEVIQGTPAAGATLDSRTGAAALPVSCIRLADVLVANGAASIATASIRDRRPWAYGVRYFYQIGPTALAGSSASWQGVTGAGAIRLELSGAPLRVSVHTIMGGDGDQSEFGYGIALDGGANPAWSTLLESAKGWVNRIPISINVVETVVNTPGSHTFTPKYLYTGPGTGGLSDTQYIAYEELVGQSAANT